MSIAKFIKALFLSLIVFSFSASATPTPIPLKIKSIHWRAVDKNGKDITKFSPTPSSITGTWYNTSNPYIDFILTVDSKPAVQTQYYIDVTYYTTWTLTSTTTASWTLFYVNAGTQFGENTYYTLTQFYGVQSFFTELVYP